MKRSQELLQQAKNVLAVDRRFSIPVMKYGKGAHVFDQDGRVYTDYCLSNGSLIVGHAHRNVMLAIKRSVNRGLSYDTVTKAEIDLARHVVKCVPSIEKVCFTDTAFGALKGSIDTAQSFTGKEKTVVFEGCLPGYNLENLCAKDNVISLAFNDKDSFVRAIDQEKDKIACVIVTPVQIGVEIVLPKEDFLQVLRKITTQHGIILIFDERVTGFRASRECVQGEWNVIPDMTCLGGVLGGGFPLGAFGGRKDIMGKVSFLDDQAGTYLPGNRVAMRAGLAQLKLLSKEFYKTVNTRSEDLSVQMNAFFKERHIAAEMVSYKTMFSIRFTETHDYGDALQRHFLENNIYGPSRGGNVYFLSGMHAQKDLNDFAQKLQQYFINSRIN